jgi:CheY-like chemotaxis protein
VDHRPVVEEDVLNAKNYLEYPLSETTPIVQPAAVAKSGRSSSTRPNKSTLAKLDTGEPKSAVVLVVDDNEMNRKLLGRMLSNINVEYELAADGQEALDAMARSRNVTNDPDAPQIGLILMDMQMPICDGVEAIERIRAQKLTLPIIALTANALDEWKQKALQAGATDFATKPILRDALHAKCRQYLTTQDASIV